MSASRGRPHAGAWQRLLGGLAAAALAALAGCAPLPTRSLYGPVADLPTDVAAPSSRALSAVYANESGRVAAVDRVWQLVADRFYDPQLRGVDWSAAGERARLQATHAASDAELYRALKQMVATLGDSHTGVLTPREVVDRRAYSVARVGLFLTVADDRVVLRDVEPDSPAAEAGLRRGDVIAAANGVALDAEFVRQAQAEPAGPPTSRAPTCNRCCPPTRRMRCARACCAPCGACCGRVVTPCSRSSSTSCAIRRRRRAAWS